MLGDLIFESTGKRIVRRVIATEPPTVEVTFESTGKLFGVTANEIGTYTSVIRPDGTLFGEGHGVVMAEDGGMASWKGSGVGEFGDKGSVKYRGAVYFSSPSAHLARLNRVASVFEFESTGEGHTSTKNWEWK